MVLLFLDWTSRMRVCRGSTCPMWLMWSLWALSVPATTTSGVGFLAITCDRPGARWIRELQPSMHIGMGQHHLSCEIAHLTQRPCRLMGMDIPFLFHGPTQSPPRLWNEDQAFPPGPSQLWNTLKLITGPGCPPHWLCLEDSPREQNELHQH